MDRTHEWKYLIDVIRYGLSDGIPPKYDGKPDWAYLYRLCSCHKIEAMVCSGLEKLPETERPGDEIMKRFRETSKMGTVREAIQHFSLTELLDSFEAAGVACLPLKGIVLKEFYPRPDLRTMTDLDILFRPEQEKKVDEILLRLGYDCAYRDSHHNGYFRKPLMTVEMHHHLVSPNNRAASYYKDPWKRAKPDEDRKYVFHFGWEDYYIFMLVHMARHFQGGGTGIRSVVDIWQFMEKMKNELDWSYLDKELKKIHLGVFEEHMRKLANIWFQCEESTPFYDLLTEMLVRSGLYGTKNNSDKQRVAEVSVNKTMWYGQLRAWLHIIFPPYGSMQIHYPVLEKYPVLLPAVWIYRIFRTHFQKKGQALKVLRNAKVNTSEVQKWQKLFEELEL